MTRRGAFILAAFLISGAMWCAAYFGALFAALHLWRFLTMLEPQGLIAALLLVSGLALIGAGVGLRHAGLRWIDGQVGWPMVQAASYVVAIGALFMAAGAGAVVAIQAGAWG